MTLFRRLPYNKPIGESYDKGFVTGFCAGIAFVAAAEQRWGLAVLCVIFGVVSDYRAARWEARNTDAFDKRFGGK